MISPLSFSQMKEDYPIRLAQNYKGMSTIPGAAKQETCQGVIKETLSPD